jgi:hypothetical protein
MCVSNIEAATKEIQPERGRGEGETEERDRETDTHRSEDRAGLDLR